MGSAPKWTAKGAQTGRSKRLKVGGLESKRTVREKERSGNQRVDGRKNKTAGSKGRSKRLKVDGLIRKTDGLKKATWTDMRDESGRSKRRVTSMLVTNVGD